MKCDFCEENLIAANPGVLSEIPLIANVWTAHYMKHVIEELKKLNHILEVEKMTG